ncbi:Serine/threonine-protein kinase pknB [Gossypium arboreum]|uniref:Uncharacterized protein n=3 Tax=Gossypium TaxID=3633 RepID=A0ABR0PWU7_GOSAR|nr:uncharacterized protein LOC121229383 [Gossypium hirsutum]XP_052884252.1 uncharacterized protein LOC108451925 [Gossypium arboreum]KAK5831257.1 hypothetical protein PVK06_015052 [Gossypium arboreum]KHG17673.1 Serine/threonine-protein kinase pknB [Gossypium arboreum]
MSLIIVPITDLSVDVVWHFFIIVLEFPMTLTDCMPIRSLTLWLLNMHMLLLQTGRRRCCGGSTLRPEVHPSGSKPPDLSLLEVAIIKSCIKLNRYSRALMKDVRTVFDPGTAMGASVVLVILLYMRLARLGMKSQEICQTVIVIFEGSYRFHSFL